jgi:hypothetical protein
MTERGARGVIRRLEVGGWVSTVVGGGRGGKSRYTVLMENPEQQAGIAGETRNDKPGIANPEYRETRNVTTLNPERGDTKPGTCVPPNHHRTINEPSEVTPFGSPVPLKPDKAKLPPDWALSDEGWAYARSRQIPDQDIEDEARGFHAYWSDRTDSGSRKSQRGWEQCWATWVRRIAPRYVGNRRMAGATGTVRHGQGGSLASIVAQRRLAGEI